VISIAVDEGHWFGHLAVVDRSPFMFRSGTLEVFGVLDRGHRFPAKVMFFAIRSPLFRGISGPFWPFFSPFYGIYSVFFWLLFCLLFW
jgi:hypothetical protein